MQGVPVCSAKQSKPVKYHTDMALLDAIHLLNDLVVALMSTELLDRCRDPGFV